MNQTEFHSLFCARWISSEKVLAAKGKEYSSDIDRLHNFKAAAKIMRCTPLEACLGFMTKHLVSVVDLVEDYAETGIVSIDAVNEKIGDAINYLILMEALFKEKPDADELLQGKSAFEKTVPVEESTHKI